MTHLPLFILSCFRADRQEGLIKGSSLVRHNDSDNFRQSRPIVVRYIAGENNMR